MSLISREKLLAHFSWWPDTDENKGIFESIIARQPDVDAVPVRHGQWLYCKLGAWKCSECNNYAPFWCMASTQNLTDYCPNCGARMNGGVDDAVD